MGRGMPTRSDRRPRLSGVMVGTSDGVGAYAIKVSSPSALGGGGGGGGGASLAAARFWPCAVAPVLDVRQCALRLCYICEA
jgi:hypothetical protein